MAEEIKLRAARDLGVLLKEGFELRVVAADVVLVSEQRGVVGDDGGERRALPEQLNELVLEGSCFGIRREGRLRRGRRHLRCGGRGLRRTRVGGVRRGLLGRGGNERGEEEAGEPEDGMLGHGGYLVRGSE